jgi:ribosomal protein S18 acetylase RimI-like enzyme
MPSSKTTESIEFRFLTAADAEAWRKLRMEALEHDPEAFSSSVEEHERLSVEDVRKRITDDPASRFVVGAFVDGRLAGMAGFYRDQGPKTRHKGHISGVYMTAGARRKGIGRRMMQALLERATKLTGIEQIQLAVTSTQGAAIGLYRALGFVPFARELKALKLGERYIDEEFLVLWLPEQGSR